MGIGLSHGGLVSNLVRFVYRDAKGNITGRRIEDRTDAEDYIQGVCLDRGDLRTFRLDRVLEYVAPDVDIEARVRFYRDSSPPPQASSTRPRPPQGTLEICFTGFVASTKASLEEAARSAGLFVRGDVTKNLRLLCCGPTAGPQKVRKARQLGAIALTEQNFREFLSTGELPD